MERSFAAEVKQLAFGDGQILRGEGILAITKALLQSGVSYVGGYPGAPVSHLLDVLADANRPLLEPMGVYLDASANEAAAAALLGASINYPMRGAVTWKSIVGTNVAADALSNLASAGVIGGALIVVGEDYGAGASVIQERTHAFALKSSLCLIDPRPSLQNMARMVEEGFGMSEASNLPAVISLRIRAAHLRGAMVCKDNVRPRISMLDRLLRPSFDYGRLSHPPSTYVQEAQKFERRLPSARRFVVERGLNELHPGDDRRVGIILQGGVTPTVLRALELVGQADVYGRSRIPLLVLNVIQDEAGALRAHPPGTWGDERRDGGGDGLPEAGPRRDLRDPSRGHRRSDRALGGAAVAWWTSNDRAARADDVRARFPPRVGARTPPLPATHVAQVPARVGADVALGAGRARRGGARSRAGRGGRRAGPGAEGYGEVRRRLTRVLERLLGEVLPGAVAGAREAGQGYARAAQAVRDARLSMLEDENAIDALLATPARGGAEVLHG
jgi:hypothetical protein